MNRLQVGFSRVNITPPLGVSMLGYYRKRQAEGVLDELEANCICLACDDSRVALISVDHLGVGQLVLKAVRQQVAEVLGAPFHEIYLHSTHTHTAPAVDPESELQVDREYYQTFVRKVADSVVLALQDLQPARMGYGTAHAHDVAYIRRFLMKNGEIHTNPSMNDPEIVGPVGEVDERVHVLRFDRESDTVILANFGNHPDTVGGSKISADWPGLVRQYTERAIPGTRCVFFNGVQGDVNHENRFPQDWEDNQPYAYANAQRIGRVITGSIMQVFDKMHYVDVETVKYVEKLVDAPTNRPDPADMPWAYNLQELRRNKQRHLIPYTGMMYTTMVAKSARMIRLEHGPDFLTMPVCGVAVGPVAFVGISGEPFSGVGFALKDTQDWALVLPTCCTNGREGYYPMRSDFIEGGYEAASSNFKAGIAELLIETGKQILEEMKA